ncbi:MAG: acyl-CoA dehydrogenase [Lachnospiraceae bacterium]|nr:acyl-CoA dehydrogenase [Candidatus Equihabitans merdae]
MDFQLTKEQEMIRKMVADFAENEVKPIAAEIDQTEQFPMENIQKLFRYGVMGMNMPREYGGAGADDIAYAMAVEELGKKCATTACVVASHNSLACWPILKFGTEEQKNKYLPRLTGGTIGAFCLTEPNAGTDASAQQTVAVEDGDSYVINGSKIFITNGGVADIFIVFAMTDKSKGTRGISAFIVEGDTPGFARGKLEDKMGIRASSTTELVFTNMRIPKENLLGQLGKGFNIAMATLDGGRIGIAAQALGIAQGALDVTVNYVKERTQFGRPIAKFQNTQFRIAEMEARICAARHLVYDAAHRKYLSMQGKKISYTKEAAMAKLFASETAMEVTTKCVQLHGGYGYTKDYPVERMMRDAKITEIYEGTSEVQKMVISGQVMR